MQPAGKDRLAIVLSGGGAKGAYEAGVIKYLREELPESIQKNINFDIISGVSVGGINCSLMAGLNHRPELQGKRLSEVWAGLKIDGIYRMHWRDLKKLPQFAFGIRKSKIRDVSKKMRIGGLFDTTPLEELVRREIDWDGLRQNIRSGNVKALALNATHVQSGKTHIFVDRFEGGLPPWSTDSSIEALPVEIGPQHALASAAIPWIFPAVNIDGQIYCDGSVKSNTPLSPALRLGAKKIFVIGLAPEIHEEDEKTHYEEHVAAYPSALFLLGKLFNGLMVDKTEYEFKRLERFNELLRAGRIKYGAQFESDIASVMSPLRGAAYREVDTLMIRPSEDLNVIAMRHLRSGNIAERTGGILKPLIRRLIKSEVDIGDIAAFLMFDGQFAQDLIRLGMQDADGQRQKLMKFFS